MAERLDAQVVGRENIVEAWREATRPAYECEPLAPDRFDASMIAYNLDGVMVGRVRFDRSRIIRTRSMLRDDETDGIGIGYYLSGSVRGRIGDQELHRAPDRISFEDLAVPCEGLAEASELLGVMIPRDRITSGERLGVRRPLFSLRLNTAPGSLLVGAMRLLWDELSAGRVHEPAVVAGAFVGLVNGLIEHGVEAAERSTAARRDGAATCVSIFGDPTLGPDHLQRAFSYSRSAIYRLFEQHGGVAAFIRSERLRRCHGDLLRSSSPHAVSAIAARYGFYDGSHFSRIFRRRYGIAPSQLTSVGAGQGLGPATPCSGVSTSVATIRSWFEDL